ncbi:MAG TPA: molybdenum cofactor guanylyltransferase [Thermoanaerobaculia bacterium]|nr:molybdenum cofactor guanylyltransferase [Thermoanaerobaculia bacterium]
MAFGFVLVGGHSGRMGRDKTVLPYRGVPMALWQAEKLSLVCGRAALVGKQRGPFSGAPYAFVEDGAEPLAAAFGVVAALAWSPEETNIILAADVPRCPEAFLAALLEVAEAIQAPAIVPVSGGRPQTLCAVWRKSALVPLTGRLAAGDYSLQGALVALGAVLIPEEETARMPGGDPSSFFNVNTQEDYERLEHEAADASWP